MAFLIIAIRVSRQELTRAEPAPASADSRRWTGRRRVASLCNVTPRLRGWRRWLAGAAFLIALAVLSSRTCRSESASAEVRFRVGQAGGDLRQLEAELFRPGDDELIGFYRRSYDRGVLGEAGRWPLRADPGLYRMKIALVSSGGTTRVDRGVDLRDGAVVTIDLEADLAAR
jgi:hypothetical protein